MGGLLQQFTQVQQIGQFALAIGKAGATNAGLLAISILSNARPELRTQLREFRREQTDRVRQEHLP